MATNLDLIDFISFFEAEPVCACSDTEWYLGARFSSERGNDKFVATVAPGDGEFKFCWWREGLQMADIELCGVESWDLESSAQRERLILKSSDQKLPYFILQLKPHVSFAWRVLWA